MTHYYIPVNGLASKKKGELRALGVPETVVEWLSERVRDRKHIEANAMDYWTPAQRREDLDATRRIFIAALVELECGVVELIQYAPGLNPDATAAGLRDLIAAVDAREGTVPPEKPLTVGRKKEWTRDEWVCGLDAQLKNAGVKKAANRFALIKDALPLCDIKYEVSDESSHRRILRKARRRGPK